LNGQSNPANLIKNVTTVTIAKLHPTVQQILNYSENIRWHFAFSIHGKLFKKSELSTRNFHNSLEKLPKRREKVSMEKRFQFEIDWLLCGYEIVSRVDRLWADCQHLNLIKGNIVPIDGLH
jgi:hypothetical protein